MALVVSQHLSLFPQIWNVPFVLTSADILWDNQQTTKCTNSFQHGKQCRLANTIFRLAYQGGDPDGEGFFYLINKLTNKMEVGFPWEMVESAWTVQRRIQELLDVLSAQAGYPAR